MDIERYRGDSKADKFSITDKEDGSAVDLTGCTFLLTLDSRKNPTDTSTQIYQLTGTVSDPTSGVVTFAPSTTQANLVGYYYYDVQMTDAAGAVSTLVSGKYLYKQDITK